MLRRVHWQTVTDVSKDKGSSLLLGVSDPEYKDKSTTIFRNVGKLPMHTI